MSENEKILLGTLGVVSVGVIILLVARKKSAPAPLPQPAPSQTVINNPIDTPYAPAPYVVNNVPTGSGASAPPTNCVTAPPVKVANSRAGASVVSPYTLAPPPAPTGVTSLATKIAANLAKGAPHAFMHFNYQIGEWVNN